MKLFYFSRIRDQIGVAEEERQVPAEITTVGHLIEWLKVQGPAYREALGDPALVRAAVNQQHAMPHHEVGPQDEVAFFPPVTGG